MMFSSCFILRVMFGLILLGAAYSAPITPKPGTGTETDGPGSNTDIEQNKGPWIDSSDVLTRLSPKYEPIPAGGSYRIYIAFNLVGPKHPMDERLTRKQANVPLDVARELKRNLIGSMMNLLKGKVKPVDGKTKMKIIYREKWNPPEGGYQQFTYLACWVWKVNGKEGSHTVSSVIARKRIPMPRLQPVTLAET
ncbi:hypothetical protein C8R42DRAFT_317194 [Lentinula raphanica]|nr:hypothetical protein C8R42DRAFT_317194 [Lentinula raphanica]